MELKTTFQHYYPEGVYGGQCAAFLHNLLAYPSIGDSLAQKKAAIDKYGIKFAQLNGHFEVGDIVVEDVGTATGHVYCVNTIVAPQLQVTESNYHLDGLVHHTRIVPVSSKIYGVIRGAPLKIAIINPPLQKTFMGLTVLANRLNWTTLFSKLEEVKQMFLTYSRNMFEPVFTIKNTNFTPPFPKMPINEQFALDANWYRTNVTPLCATSDQATIFSMNPEDYNNGLTYGFMTWGDPGKPVRIEVAASEVNFDYRERVFHEICHALLFLTGQPDRVHELLYQSTPQYQTLVDYVDLRTLQQRLVQIKH